jgi:hypothetical protein
LGELLPFGRLFSSGSVLATTETSPTILATFVHGKSYLLNLTKKTGWESFLVIFVIKNLLPDCILRRRRVRRDQNVDFLFKFF